MQPETAINREVQTVTITVPFDPYTLRTNQRMHPMKRYRLSQQAKNDAINCWKAAGKPVLNGMVTVDIEVRRKGRRLDDFACSEGLKHTIDGLFNNAITKSDHPRWCHFNTPAQVKWSGPPEVVFTIRGDGTGPNSRGKGAA